MTATTVDVNVEKIGYFGVNKKGWKIGRIDSGAMAAQNDLWDVGNIKELIDIISMRDDTTGAFTTATFSGNTITHTTATTGAKTAFVLYK